MKLTRGDWQFGCAGRHREIGTKDCPRELHHHHDVLCASPTKRELRQAGINPKEFRVQSRALGSRKCQTSKNFRT